MQLHLFQTQYISGTTKSFNNFLKYHITTFMELKLFFKQAFPNVLGMEERIDLVFKKEVYQKGTILLMPEHFSTKLYFIEQGLIRTYYLNNGKDITHEFFDQNAFLGPIDCFYYNKPSMYGFEVLEQTTVSVTTYEKMVESKLMEISGMKELEKSIIINQLTQSSNKGLGTHIETALSRYKFMLEKHPDILRRSKLGHVASYLGITQQTLSVIRGMQ